MHAQKHTYITCMMLTSKKLHTPTHYMRPQVQMELQEALKAMKLETGKTFVLIVDGFAFSIAREHALQDLVHICSIASVVICAR